MDNCLRLTTIKRGHEVKCGQEWMRKLPFRREMSEAYHGEHAEADHKIDL